MEAILFRYDICPQKRIRINYYVYPDWTYYMTFETY